MENRVPGTTRKRITAANGTVIERQFIYLEPHQWANVTKLARLQGISGSQVIARLIDLATTFRTAE
jgi:macrodomain Ter protein organizer (MatP/YcbG family)